MDATGDLTHRDIFHQVMSFTCPGKTLVTLGGIWRSTLERWQAEGMPPELASPTALIQHFELDPHVWTAPAAELFVYPAFPRQVIREEAETITYVNPMGVVCTEFRKDAYKSMPHFESFPIQNRSDWLAFRHRLQWQPERVGEAWHTQIQAMRQTEAPVILALNRGGSLYGALRDLIGVEALSYLFYDDPPLIAEMMDTLLELACHSIEALFTDYVPDAVCLWEDMAYNHGSLLGIDHVREFMLPRYPAMVKKLRDAGVPYILLDSDGCIDELIPIWLEAGIDGLVPMEVQSGMDVAHCRERYPDMLMMGGIDKKALAAGPQAIDREMAKVEATIASGGYIPFFDHGLPHDVSWKNFCHFVAGIKQFQVER